MAILRPCASLAHRTAWAAWRAGALVAGDRGYGAPD